MIPMKLLKCKSCGRYHFAIGYVTLNLSEKELSVMRNLITQTLINIREDESDPFGDIGTRERGNLMMH